MVTVPELRPCDVGTLVTETGVPSAEATAYDYIIVGGGTAGCCLASRLSEDPTVTVLLLERGDVADTWASRVPLISSDFYRNGSQAVKWESLPMPEVDNRVQVVVCGEGLGGTSRVNSLIYTRGAPGDYNRWKAMGHPGWGYDELLPYFVKSETTLSQLPSSYRGRNGPWPNQVYQDSPYQVQKQVNQAARAIGIPFFPDVNSPDAPSVGYFPLDVTVDRSMYRASTYRAFLPPELAQGRKTRLKISTNTLVTRIASSVSPDGILRATGVHFESVNVRNANRKYFACARREVVLCCGAIGSPQVLQLSGFGPKDHLKAKGVTVVRDMPGVGSCLQDHVGVPVMYEVPIVDSLHILQNSMWKVTIELLKYVTFGRGMFSFPLTPASIFVSSRLLNNDLEVVNPDPHDLNSRTPDHVPDIEIMPIANNCSDYDIKNKGIFSLLTTLLKPKSRGTVRLVSSSPRARPEVTLGFLTNPDDYIVLRKSVRLALRLARQVANQTYPLTQLQVPTTAADEDIDKFIRTNLRTSYHYTSTCRMGSETDATGPGVVDDELRVHGVQGLRVCDASVFPEIIAAHTTAPVVVIAEKCADMIKEAAR